MTSSIRMEDTLTPAIEKSISLLRKRVERAAESIGEDVLHNAYPFVPIDTGRMVSSAYNSPSESTEHRVVRRVGYATEYAMKVHDTAELIHGAAYNIKYAKRIASGIDHLRRDTEQFKFLSKGVVLTDTKRHLRKVLKNVF